MTPDRCVVASSNAGKLRELRKMLEPLAIEPVAQGELNIDPAPEPHPTFIENCLAKARHAARESGLPALADDSGICVPALGGAPGVYSARFAERAGAGSGDAANNAHLVRELARYGSDHPDSDPYTAYYYCVLIWINAWDDPQPMIADARWYGRVIEAPRGDGGFGYDPHFLLTEPNQTAAELSAERKNRISHRGQAMRALQAQLIEARHGASS
jgi:XTP/dITP diphosphohydrolase